MKISNVLVGLCLLLALACSNKKMVDTKHSNGQIMEQYTLNADQEKDGMYRSFYENGNKYEEANYSKGVLTGERKIYFQNGNIDIIEVYNQSGQLDGEYKAYHENGKLKVEKFYKNNLMEGVLKVYYPSGNIKEEVLLTNNTENGPFTEYFENGKIQWKGTYLNGDNEFGLLEEFDSTGTLIKKMECDSLAICRTVWKSENYIQQ